MNEDKKGFYVVHFKTRLKHSDRNKLTRENYCIPTDKISCKNKKNIRIAQEFYEINKRYPLFCPGYYCNIPNDVFRDGEHFTEQFIEKHYRDCMENFDLNINFFNSLDIEDFKKHLSVFVKKNRFKEIDDLKKVSLVQGIYILVLDEYKQVYIGISTDIKKRILGHWSRKKEFDHLLHGKVEESILSIDSFGALDTTRIFYKSCSSSEMHNAEENYISKFESIYRLNRIAGGINSEENNVIRNLKILASTQKRELK